MTSLKKVLIPSSILVFAFVSYLYFPSSLPINECSNVFSSGVYAGYHASLAAFVNSHPSNWELKKKGPSETQMLLSLFDKTADTPQRVDHEAFVSQLRKAIQQDHTVPFLQDLVRWIHLQPGLSIPIQKFFESVVEMPYSTSIEHFSELQKKLYRDSRFNGKNRSAHFGDSYLHGNLPYSLEGSFPFSFIRMGKPLYDTLYFNSLRLPGVAPSVSPEFLLFVEGQSKHVYVNLMKRHGMEGQCSKVLEQIEKEVPTLQVITLDKDSPFYWQRASIYPKEIEYTVFKEMFLEALTKRDGHYYWSLQLDPVSWNKTLADLIDQTHQIYFDKQPFLSRDDRRDLIELTYLAILDNLVDRWHPCSLNITCSQGMDRGPSLMVLWALQKDGNKHDLTAMLLAPPLLIHNRASHASRIQRFVSAAERIQQCSFVKSAL